MNLKDDKSEICMEAQLETQGRADDAAQSSKAVCWQNPFLGVGSLNLCLKTFQIIGWDFPPPHTHTDRE